MLAAGRSGGARFLPSASLGPVARQSDRLAKEGVAAGIEARCTVGMDPMQPIRRRFEALSPHLDEKSLSLLVASETLPPSLPSSC